MTTLKMGKERQLELTLYALFQSKKEFGKEFDFNETLKTLDTGFDPDSWMRVLWTLLVQHNRDLTFDGMIEELGDNPISLKGTFKALIEAARAETDEGEQTTEKKTLKQPKFKLPKRK